MTHPRNRHHQQARRDRLTQAARKVGYPTIDRLATAIIREEITMSRITLSDLKPGDRFIIIPDYRIGYIGDDGRALDTGEEAVGDEDLPTFSYEEVWEYEEERGHHN